MDLMKMTGEEQERLQKRVQNRIEGMTKGKTEKKNRWKALAMAAAAGIVLLPAGGYAAGKIVEFYKQDGYRLEIEANEKQRDVVSEKTDWVKLSYELPEGYTMQKNTEDAGWYDLIWKGDEELGKEVSFVLMQEDKKQGDTLLAWEDVETAQDFTVSGNRAAYLRFNGVVGSAYEGEKERQSNYIHRLIVFYEEQGYVMEYCATRAVSKEEMIQIAEGIGLQSCKKEEADEYCLLSEEYPDASLKKEITPLVLPPGTEENRIAADQVHQTGETVAYDGLDYTVKDVQVMDSIAGLKEEYFDDSMQIMNRKDEFCESDGTLKRYLRETIAYGDGYRTPAEKVVDKKEVSLRFVKVQMEVENRTNEDIEFQACKAMEILIKNDTGYQLCPKRFNRPSVVRDCMLDHYAKYYEQTTGGKGFYLGHVKAGERVACTIGFFVDEDLVEDACINVGGESSIFEEHQYIALK